MSTTPARQRRTDAPDNPDARILALDIGVYGHRGAVCGMFWYRNGGRLHTHTASLLPDDATILDQLDVVEAMAEQYPEYWRVPPVVVIGVTVLSHVGKHQVRGHLDGWYNPPHLRRLVSIGDYAGEHTGVRGLVTRKKLRDLLAHRLTEHTITLTKDQHDAVALYTGRRVKPGRDSDDEWRADDTDAMALPVALSCYAATTLLPPAAVSPEDRYRHTRRAARAWQIELGMGEREAWEQAERRGHPRAVLPSGPASPDTPKPPGPMRRPDPGTRQVRSRDVPTR